MSVEEGYSLLVDQLRHFILPESAGGQCLKIDNITFPISGVIDTYFY